MADNQKSKRAIGNKRKREDKADQRESATTKRRARSPEEDDELQQILLLEKQILESRKHLNNVAHLIQKFRTLEEDAATRNAAAVSLCRVFCKLRAIGNMTIPNNVEDKEARIRQWLKQRYEDYVQELFRLLFDDDLAQSRTALTLLMRLIKEEGNEDGGTGLFNRVLTGVLSLPENSDALEEFVETYMKKYDDIRYYTFGCIAKLNVETLPPQTIENVLYTLKESGNAPDKDEAIASFYYNAEKSKKSKQKHPMLTVRGHKRKAQDAWMTLLRCPLTKEQRKAMLGLMSYQIAPWFLRPEMLFDFLTDSYNVGGSTSLLALSGLFYLIKEKNLDYPQFFHKLYSLLDSSILHSKHRSRFFRLLDTFLASSHLPAALIASFIKRLCRLALNAPPSGIVVIVPFVYNLFKRHPSTTFMMHRLFESEKQMNQILNLGMDDPFSMEETDPMETRAIDSCVWELVTLQQHYQPNVATIAKIISEQFTKQSYNLEDFLDHSYASMLNTELSKDVKKVPVVEFQIPKKILTRYEVEAGIEDELLAKLWEFK